MCSSQMLCVSLDKTYQQRINIYASKEWFLIVLRHSYHCSMPSQISSSLLGGVVTVEEKRLFQLPTYLAGLGIYDPTETAVPAYKTSRQGTATVS